MKKIAVVQDLSGLGKCSLTAAIPVISAMGVQACPFPTAVLSNQTGYESYYCDDFTDRMDIYMEEWEKRGFHPDGIYTGFLASDVQADKVLDFIEKFQDENTKIIVDPVMGDVGAAYGIYTENLREKMCHLVRKAHVITPNLTEAVLLLDGIRGLSRLEKEEYRSGKGRDFMKKAEGLAEELKNRFHLETVILTGVSMEEDNSVSSMYNLVIDKEGCQWIGDRKYGDSYSGTGDLFTSVISAGLVRGRSPRWCVEKAVDFLKMAIKDAVNEKTDRNDGVCFEKYLYKLWEE